jgi:hypothetical protein
MCYVFLTYYCAHNGLPLGPSLYFVIYSYHAQTMTHTPPIADLQTMTHTLPSNDSLLVRLLVVSVAFQVPVLVVSAWRLVVFNLYQ